MFAEMRHKHVRPSAVTFSILVKAVHRLCDRTVTPPCFCIAHKPAPPSFSRTLAALTWPCIWLQRTGADLRCLQPLTTFEKSSFKEAWVRRCALAVARRCDKYTECSLLEWLEPQRSAGPGLCGAHTDFRRSILELGAGRVSTCE